MMRIKAPKNEAFHKIIKSVPYDVVGYEDDKVVYEGIFGFKIDADMLNMSVREFNDFVNKLIVEGGRKKRIGSFVIVTPYRKREFAVRLSMDEYAALREMADAEGRTCEDLFRELAIEAVAKRRGM